MSTTSQSDRILKLIEHSRKELDALEAATIRAADAQWSRPPAVNTGQAERMSRGGHSDPTGDTATDPKRLSVRRSLHDADRDLQRVYQVLRSVAGNVRHAVGGWEGN